MAVSAIALVFLGLTFLEVLSDLSHDAPSFRRVRPRKMQASAVEYASTHHTPEFLGRFRGLLAGRQAQGQS